MIVDAFSETLENGLAKPDQIVVSEIRLTFFLSLALFTYP